MAHKGRDFKVWFRRDLSVSVDRNEEYFPETFILDSWTGFSTEDFNFDGVEGQQLINERKDSTTIREWVGHLTSSPPIRVKPHFEVVDIRWGKEVTFRFQLTLSNTFRVLDFYCTSEVPQLRYVQWQSRAVDRFDVKDTRIDFNPSGFFIKVVPLYWSG